jgi:DNA polymerase I-like protein with 3'-5' exonuclease and polymerase domains
MSGGDKLNWQNMGRGSFLRRAVRAPAGYKIVAVDSSNIEARVLDWLAGEDLSVYMTGDPYCALASKIYDKPVTEDDKAERMLGKIAKLGLGYGMGAMKFITTCKGWGVDIDPQFAEMVVDVYRNSNLRVKALWKRFNDIIPALATNKQGHVIDPRELLITDDMSIILPNGLKIMYPELSYDRKTREYSFYNGKSREKLYGGKITENVVQALARIIVIDQTLELSEHYPVSLTVHDEAVMVVPERDAEHAAQLSKDLFSTPPIWAPDLPLAAKASIGDTYADCK